MVVGEPSLMGGEFGDEDERLITRLENNQFEATNGMEENEDFSNSPMTTTSPWTSTPGAPGGPDRPNPAVPPTAPPVSNQEDKKSPSITQ